MEKTQNLPSQIILLSVKDTLYAVDLSLITEITIVETQPSQLPMSPEHIQGLILSRSHIYPLVYFGDTNNTDREESRVLLLSSDTRHMALYADRLFNILTLTPDQLIVSEETTVEEFPFLSLNISTSQGMAQLIDFDLLYDYLSKEAERLDQPTVVI